MAPPAAAFHHRPTLKQTNRPFKSRHASKGEIKARNKGKVAESLPTALKAASSNKADRRNAAKLEQKKKRDAVTSANRTFTGQNAPQKIVAVVSLCSDTDVASAIQQLKTANGASVLADGPSPVIRLDAFKQTARLVACPSDLLAVLDVAKVADYILYLVSAVEEVPEFGKTLLAAVAAQGVVTPLAAVQHLARVPTSKRNDIKRSLMLFMQDRFPGDLKVHDLDSPNDASACLRAIATARPRAPVWRERHSYLVADAIDHIPGNLFAPSTESEKPTTTLRLTGHIRNQPLSADRLIHIVGLGTFPISSIVSANPPHSSSQSSEPILLASPTAARESTQTHNEPDPMDNEQTWPTEEELAEGERAMEMERSRRKKKVPKGTSRYQAAWILDDDDEDGEDESGSEEEDDEEMDVRENGREQQLGGDADDAEESEEDMEEIDMDAASESGNGSEPSDADEEDGDDEDEGADNSAYEEYLRIRDQEADARFPDEIDTPRDISARVRFQKYRGLKNFRSSEWDPLENLPEDYARIFQFEDFTRTKNRVMKGVGKDGVEVGTYVTVCVEGVPLDAAQALIANPTRPVVSAFALLPHENKYSLVNMTVTKTSEYQAPVKSKDEMLVQVGFRRFWVRPVYSTDTRGGPNNVHKFERFLQPGRQAMASAYLPIQFGPAPVIFLKPAEDGGDPEVVGTGSVINADPLRIVAKRIVLTGHPFKIHKRSVVVRYMFWNPEDIEWFKPVQLHTKLGRTGHIQDSIGTHGFMRCRFDGPVKAQDTICMYLYKRQFPKWNTRVATNDELQGRFGAVTKMEM